MLTVSKLSSASDAAKYYREGEYYQKDPEPGQWFGKGAEMLGLKGKVDFDVFSKLLEGKLPNGIEMPKGKNIKGEDVRRAGYDFTFSAPKSFSILEALCDNSKILDEAFKEALDSELKEMEAELAGARIKKKGEISEVKTGNWTAALFKHKVSRANDPDYHVHAVIMNITKVIDKDSPKPKVERVKVAPPTEDAPPLLDENGQPVKEISASPLASEKWRALNGDTYLKKDPDYNFQQHYGTRFRARLAKCLQERGIEVEQTKEGYWEIVGISKELITEFSKRREEILRFMSDKGWEGGKASQTANRETRHDKDLLDLKELTSDWLGRALLKGYTNDSFDKILTDAKERGPIVPPNPKDIAKSSISVAIESLTETQAVFNFKQLIMAAQAICITKQVEPGLLVQAAEKAIDKGQIIYGGHHALTTPEAKDLEQKNIQLLLKGKGTVDSLYQDVGSQIFADAYQGGTRLEKPLKELLENKDRVVALSVSDKGQRVELLQDFLRIAVRSGHKVLNLAPDGQANKQFKLETGMYSTPIHFFLENEPKTIAPEPKFWLVQASHKLTTVQFHKLHDKAVAQNAQLILMGKAYGRKNFEQGKPLEYLVKNGMKVIGVEGDKAMKASHLHAKSTWDDLIEPLKQEGYCKEITGIKAQQAYLLQKFKDNPETVVLTNNYSTTSKINEQVREILKSQGVLQNKTTQIETLKPVFMSTKHKTMTAHYQLGDCIKIHQNLEQPALEKGTYWKISAIDERKDQILLTDEVHAIKVKLSSRFAKNISVYQTIEKEFAVGERLVWQKPMNAQHENGARQKGECVKIKDIFKKYGETVLSVKRQDGSLVEICPQSPHQRHIDYAYAQPISMAEHVKGSVDLHINSKDVRGNQAELLHMALQKASSLCTDSTEKTIEACSQKKIVHASDVEEKTYKKEPMSSDTTHAIDAGPVWFPNIAGECLEKHDVSKHVGEIEKAIESNPELAEAMIAVDYAATHFSERYAVFSRYSVEKKALESAMPYAGPEDVRQAFNLAQDLGWIVGLNGYHTTRGMLQMEDLCIDAIKKGRGQSDPILTQSDPLIKTIDNIGLTEGQANVVKNIFTNPDKIMSVVGVAGSGKTHLYNAVKRLADQCDQRIIGLSPTCKAKDNLHLKGGGIESYTVAKFINQANKLIQTDLAEAKTAFGNSLVVVDEASMVSVRDMSSLVKIQEKIDCRFLPTGDDKQNQPVAASRPFFLWLAEGKNEVVMNEIFRLKTHEQLDVVKDLYNARTEDALIKLRDCIQELPNKDDRLSAMAKDYVALYKDAPDDIIAMLPRNDDRVDFSEMVREHLKNDGLLSRDEITTQIMVSKDLTEKEKMFAASYDSGDLVLFNCSPVRGIKAGEYFKVSSTIKQVVSLKNEAGEELVWRPSSLRKNTSLVEVYTQEKREISQGDRIIWMRNDEKRGIKNSDEAQVKQVDGTLATLKLTSGKHVTIDTTELKNQHFDHAYGLTVQKAQGQDKRPLYFSYGLSPVKVYGLQTLDPGEIIEIPAALNNKGERQGPVKLGTFVMLIRKERGIGKKPDFAVIAKDKDGQEHIIKNPESIATYSRSASQDKTPRSANLNAILTAMTRGDNPLVYTNCTLAFLEAIERNGQLKECAKQFQIDPRTWEEMTHRVFKMTTDVKGIIEKDNNQTLSNNNEQVGKQKIAQVSKNKAREKQVSSKNISIEKNGLVKSLPKKVGNKTKSKGKTPASLSAEMSQQGYQAVEKPKAIDTASLLDKLNSDVVGFVSNLYGRSIGKPGFEGQWSTSGTKHNHLSVRCQGSETGLWHDHKAYQGGGNLIALYAYRMGMSYGEAKELLAKDHDAYKDPTQFKEHKRDPKLDEAKRLADEKKAALREQNRIKFARSIYQASQPVKGTLAEKYLRDFRKLSIDIPKDFRFHPNCIHPDKSQRPALIAPLYREGKMVGIQRIFLNPDGSKIDKDKTDKAGLGITHGAAIHVNKSFMSGTTYTAEGLEDAMSVAKVLPHQNVQSGASISSLVPMPYEKGTSTVVICADHDGVHPQVKANLIKVVKNYLARGLKVKLACPEIPGSPDQKCDFNDVLKRHGEAAVKAQLMNAVSVRSVKDMGSEMLSVRDTVRQIEQKISEEKLHQQRADFNHETTRNPTPEMTKPVRELGGFER